MCSFSIASLSGGVLDPSRINSTYDNAMSKQQASLDSFFGGGGGAAKKQTKLNFGGGSGGGTTGSAKSKSSAAAAEDNSPSKAKENVGNSPPVDKEEAGTAAKKPAPAAAAEPKAAAKTTNAEPPAEKAKDNAAELMDTDDDEADDDKPVATGKRGAASESKSASDNTNTSSGKKKRRVIEDSDSDGDDEGGESNAGDDRSADEKAEEPMEVEVEAEYKKGKQEEEEFKPDKDEEEEEDDLMDDSDDEDAKPSAKPSAKAATDTKKKSINQVLKHSTSTTGKKKSDAVAKGMLSNDKLLDADAHPWKTGTPVPYAALCATFAHIESISSRLDIQQSLTTLFRKTVLRNPSDLYQLIYLASNSVAPAYECIELGVGDSILIKAIGEASGTNPSMVKQRYEAEGDLGTVASSAKAKQRTLGFAFAKPKPLLAKEVLGAFKKIVSVLLFVGCELTLLVAAQLTL